jgi:hypothetical protein
LKERTNNNSEQANKHKNIAVQQQQQQSSRLCFKMKSYEYNIIIFEQFTTTTQVTYGETGVWESAVL